MDNVDFPEKFYKLQEVKKRLLLACDLCSHTGLIEDKDCKCFKKFKKYVEYSYAGIDEEYWDMTFKEFQSDQVAKEDAEKYCQNIDNARKNGLGFVIHGTNGTGKTLLACLILMQAKRSKYSIYFITFAELLEIIKKSFDSDFYKTLYTKIKQADFLVLDELGSEYRPKDIESFCVSQLSLLSRYRRRNNFCTIVTTNLDKNDFISTYGKTINSLFTGCSRFLKVNGPDWREKQNKNWNNKLLGKNE